MREVPVRDGEITLGQLLQVAGLADTGGHAKLILQAGEVQVNDELEDRRGRKLHAGDVVEVPGHETLRVTTADG
jgi:ribosome-associated protein